MEETNENEMKFAHGMVLKQGNYYYACSLGMTVHGQTLFYRPLHTACARFAKFRKGNNRKEIKMGRGDGRPATHKDKDRCSVLFVRWRKDRLGSFVTPAKGMRCTDKYHARKYYLNNICQTRHDED